MFLLVLAVGWGAFRILGLSLIEPAATVATLLVAAAIVAGTVSVLIRRDAPVVLASTALTTLLVPISASVLTLLVSGSGRLAPGSLRESLMNVFLMAVLAVLLVGSTRALALGGMHHCVAIPLGIILAVVIALCGLLALADSLDGMWGQVTETASPGGAYVVVQTIHDSGALGSAIRYHVLERVLPFVAVRIDVRFDDSYYHDVSWYDTDVLAVDGQPFPLHGKR